MLNTLESRFRDLLPAVGLLLAMAVQPCLASAGRDQERALRERAENIEQKFKQLETR